MRCGWRRWRRLWIGNINTLTQDQLPTKPTLEVGFVVLIAPSGSYRIIPYLNAAQSLGLGLIVVSNSKHSLIPEVARGITVDFSEISQARSTILSVIRHLKILCVIATDDSCVDLSNQIAEHLGLPHNSITTTHLTHRKDLARQVLRQAGCNTPEFQIISTKHATEHSLDIDYPVVLKPLSLSGSHISGLCSDFGGPRQGKGNQS